MPHATRNLKRFLPGNTGAYRHCALADLGAKIGAHHPRFQWRIQGTVHPGASEPCPRWVNWRYLDAKKEKKTHNQASSAIYYKPPNKL